MSKTKLILKRTGLGILILAVLLAGGGGFYFKSYLPNTVAPKSFPQIDGEIQIEGLDGPVDIYRDQRGIANIYATTPHDLFFAQGFVHASERFWQMDFYRHVGEGRTAELFGSSQVEDDIFLTTLGWRKTSQEEYEAMTPESKAILQAYADGVNAYLAGKSNEELSLEYAVLDLPIINPDYIVEPWEPVNTLAWAKALAWDLKSNLSNEIERAVLMKTLSADQMTELFPPYPADNPVIVNKIGEGTSSNESSSNPAALDIPIETLLAVEQNAASLDDLFGSLGDGVGSNSWAITGEKTTTGKPLLANDPHLGIGMPSIFYQNSLHCQPKNDACPYDLAGFSLAGAPGILLGHNDRIAWGFTFSYEDVMDLFIERVNPENPNQYEINGEWVDFETWTETINVAGGDSVEITVRATRHGPVISDVYGPLKNVGDPDDEEFVPFKDRAGIELPEQYVIALSWTALSTGNKLTKGNPLEAVWGFNRAQNWEEFRKAAGIFHTPGHNILYADVDGNIGYVASGDVPIRKNGDGTLPVPGWDSEYDWVGIVPAEEMPYTLNPVEGYIAPSNNKIVGDEYPYLLAKDWNYGFRARRIVNMIEAAPGLIDIAYMQNMQRDAHDFSAETYVPLLMQLDGQFDKPNETTAFELLKNWDYQAQADSAGAAVYAAFWRNLLKNTLHDQLPQAYQPLGSSRWFEVMRNLAANPDSSFWDDTATVNAVETQDEILKKSFRDGVAELEDTLGNDPSAWTWGALHVSNFVNGTLGSTPISLINDLFNRGPFPTGGGSSIVNATAWDYADGYEVTDIPAMRTVYDLSDFNNTVTVHSTGQSGHAYHPHYDDLAPLWTNLEYYSMLWDRANVEAGAEGHLVLTPK
jgi:penicillin amidase